MHHLYNGTTLYQCLKGMLNKKMRIFVFSFFYCVIYELFEYKLQEVKEHGKYGR